MNITRRSAQGTCMPGHVCQGTALSVHEWRCAGSHIKSRVFRLAPGSPSPPLQVASHPHRPAGWVRQMICLTPAR
eukprot:6670876-Alexandrium_andersonii.AAC.1